MACYHHVSAPTIKINLSLKQGLYCITRLTRIVPSRTVRIIRKGTHTSGECTRLACSEEIAVGTAVAATQQDPSFQFPAPVSIPALFHAGTCEVGTAKKECSI